MPTPTDTGSASRRHLAARIVIVVVVLSAAVVFVLSSLRRPAIEVFVVTPPAPMEVGDAMVGPRIYTIEASGQSTWTYFDFSRGSAVPDDDPLGWDVAFRRFGITLNGGAGFAGSGGVVDLGPVPFDSVFEAPASGYVQTNADSVNLAIERWYDYGFTSHILTSKGNVYVIQTADGRYAKLEIIGYYCAGATPGCPTFRYVYQGDGTRNLRAAGSTGAASGGPGIITADSARQQPDH